MNVSGIAFFVAWCAFWNWAAFPIVDAVWFGLLDAVVDDAEV